MKRYIKLHRPKNYTIVCKECNRKRRHHAKGLCQNCYKNLWYSNFVSKFSKKQKRKIRNKRRKYRKKYLALGGRYHDLKYRARIRNLEFSIEKEWYTGVVSGNCEYCRFPIGPTVCGLDRIDNSKGYLMSNVLPCCYECNCARNDNFSVEEMRKYIGPAIRKIKLKRRR